MRELRKGGRKTPLSDYFEAAEHFVLRLALLIILIIGLVKFILYELLT
jgi:hypothetical protein